jgi:nicotinate phosphoribosyltransferase
VPAGAIGLLEPVMRGGELLRAHPPLAEIRARCAAQLAALPDGVRRLGDPAAYAPVPSELLRERQRRAEEQAEKQTEE